MYFRRLFVGGAILGRRRERIGAQSRNFCKKKREEKDEVKKVGAAGFTATDVLGFLAIFSISAAFLYNEIKDLEPITGSKSGDERKHVNTETAKDSGEVAGPATERV